MLSEMRRPLLIRMSRQGCHDAGPIRLLHLCCCCCCCTVGCRRATILGRKSDGGILLTEIEKRLHRIRKWQQAEVVVSGGHELKSELHCGSFCHIPSVVQPLRDIGQFLLFQGKVFFKVVRLQPVVQFALVQEQKKGRAPPDGAPKRKSRGNLKSYKRGQSLIEKVGSRK